MSRLNSQNNNQYPPNGSYGGSSPLQHQQQPYHPTSTPTSPRMNFNSNNNNPDRSYPPQQPIGYQPGGPGGYDHSAGHYGYDMIDESDNAGLMSNQGRAGGRNNGFNKGLPPRSASRLDRVATMNRRVTSKLYKAMDPDTGHSHSSLKILILPLLFFFSSLSAMFH